jgi:hypothetical protein
MNKKITNTEKYKGVLDDLQERTDIFRRARKRKKRLKGLLSIGLGLGAGVALATLVPTIKLKIDEEA